MPIEGTFAGVGKLPDGFVIEIGDHGGMVPSGQKAGILGTAFSKREPQHIEANKVAARKLVSEVRANYGSKMAEMTESSLASHLKNGEPLTAGQVKKVLGSADQRIAEITRHGFTPEEAAVALKHGLSLDQMMQYRDATMPICEATLVRDFVPFNQVGWSKSLSGGALGAPQKLDYQPPGDTRKTYVFKRESPEGLGGAEHLLGIPKSEARLGARNIATGKLDARLGFGLTPRTEMARHNGELGMVMEFVSGKAGFIAVTERTPATEGRIARYKELEREINNPDTPREERVELSKQLAALHVEKEGEVYFHVQDVDKNVQHDMSDPGIRKAFVNLQLLDALTAQVDRHRGNFIVQRDAGGGFAGLKAIDNDQCFGPQVRDFSGRLNNQPATLPPVVDTDMVRAFEGVTPQTLRADLAGLLPTAEIDAAVERLAAIKAHINTLVQTGRVIRPDQWGSQDVTDMLTPRGAPRDIEEAEQTTYIGREMAVQMKYPGKLVQP
ncbi:MAG: hypothetical protein ACAI35_19040 [Candidatus Methylacidiphilales bacterium]